MYFFSRSKIRITLVVLVVFAASFLLLVSVRSGARAVGQTDWPMFGYDPQHSHFNQNEQTLSPANVSTLTPAWTLATPNGIGSSVAVANGIAYVGSGDGNLYAANATNGTVLWSAPTR